MSDQFVQSGKASGSGTAVVVLSGVVAGNTLVAFGFNGQDAFPTLHSCADVPDGAYTAGSTGLDTSNSVFGQVFTKENCAAGTHTVTFTTDVAEVCDLYVVEVTAPTSSAVAGTNAAGQSAPGTGANALASGTVTFTGAYTLVGFSTDSASVSAGNIPNVGTSPNSFTSRDSGTSSVIGAWRLETAAAATTAGATATAVAGGDNYVTLVAAVANGGAGPVSQSVDDYRQSRRNHPGRGPYSIGRFFRSASIANIDTTIGARLADANLTQDANTLSAAAVVPSQSAAALVQAANTLSAAATIAVTAALSKTQDDQTLAATGSSISGANGSLDLSQAANTLSATALVAVTAALSISQGADTLTADATITGSGPVTADLTITQNDQILLGSASGPSSSSGAGSSTGTGQQRRRRHKKYIVEIDGEQFSVANVAEAQELLAEAQLVAEQKAQQELDKALESRMRPNKLRRVIVHKLQTPEIRVPDSEIDPIASQIEAQAQEFRKRVSELYADIVRSAEIGVLLRRQQDEEDDFIISLFL